MANHRVAWVLLFSYVALLGISTVGIGVGLLYKTDAPIPPDISNQTTDVTTPAPRQDSYYRNDYGNRYPEVPQEVKNYTRESQRYANYLQNIPSYLIVPSGVNILMALPLILGGLCSRGIFSTSVGLYSSLALWAVNLTGMIMFQTLFNQINHESIENFSTVFAVVLGTQLGMIAITTLQVVLAAWEIRRQKIGWPVIHLSHIFTPNTVVICVRLAVGIMPLQSYALIRFMEGFRIEQYKKTYPNLDYYDLPRERYPEYLAYPLVIGLVYCVLAPAEGICSHILGHLHTKMLSFTAAVSAILYGGIIVITSPSFVTIVLSHLAYPEIMYWAIGAMILCFGHAIACAAAPETMRRPPMIIRNLANPESLSSLSTLLPQSPEGLRTQAAVLRNKFKGSNTLLCNTFLLGLSSLAIILELCHSVYWWQGVAMLCGNVLVCHRVLPLVIMEALTGRTEKIPALQTLMNYLVEVIILMVGTCGSFSWFYDEIAAAIIINIIINLLMTWKIVKDPTLKTVAKTLSVEEPPQQEGHQQLISEDPNESNSLSNQEEVESGGIYNPGA